MIEILPNATGHDPIGARVLNGGEPGTVVRCPECGGSGQLHKLDVMPEPVSPGHTPNCEWPNTYIYLGLGNYVQKTHPECTCGAIPDDAKRFLR